MKSKNLKSKICLFSLYEFIGDWLKNVEQTIKCAIGQNVEKQYGREKRKEKMKAYTIRKFHIFYLSILPDLSSTIKFSFKNHIIVEKIISIEIQ